MTPTTPEAEAVEVLLPCPCCGGDAGFNRTVTSDKEMIRLNRRNVGHGVNCVVCGLNNRGVWIGYATKEKAAAAWNTRAPPNAVQGWRLVPEQLTDAMRLASDADTPYNWRRTIDKSGYEVVQTTNEDWRECIGTVERLAFYHTEHEAEQHALRLDAQFRWAEMLAAAPTPPKEADRE
jgi:hypothetical protein